MNNLNTKTVGIIGGVGPETTSKIYLEIINYFKKNKIKKYPSILVYNLPFPFSVEREAIVEGKNVHKMLPYLLDGAKILKKGGADFCVLPCNTLHKYIEVMRGVVPFLSIFEETLIELQKLNIKDIGLLATGTTFKERLYDNTLQKNNINIFYPTPTEQNILSNIIINLLNGKKNTKDIQNLQKICLSLNKKGARAILLACTDLQMISKDLNLNIPIVDTTSILTESTIKELIKK